MTPVVSSTTQNPTLNEPSASEISPEKNTHIPVTLRRLENGIARDKEGDTGHIILEE